jgi:hypothetical protein
MLVPAEVAIGLIVPVEMVVSIPVVVVVAECITIETTTGVTEDLALL